MRDVRFSIAALGYPAHRLLDAQVSMAPFGKGPSSGTHQVNFSESVIMKRFLWLLTAATAGFAIASACTETQDNGKVTGASSRKVDGNAEQIGGALTTYIKSILTGDIDGFQSVASNETMAYARQQAAAANRSVRSFIAGYLASEKNKMYREGFVTTGPFSLDVVDVRPRGSDAIEAFFSISGKNVPKALTLVLENGVNKISLISRSLSRDNYQIFNEIDERKMVSCSGGSSVDIPTTGEWAVSCEDIKCGRFSRFSGTKFYHDGAEYHCDWNNFGIDFFLLNGGGARCNDRCF
jgi:hypothetical protein